jgi:hypothetical protein
VLDEGSLLSALNIGSSREVLTASPQSPLSKLLQELTQDVIDQLTKRVEHYNIEGTNNLKQSIKPTKVQNKGGQIDIGITADFYWKFVNYGVNGTEVQHGAPDWGSTPSTKSFKESIAEWRSAKGITLPPSFSSYDSLDYAIMTNVKKKGKEPRPFFTDVVNERLVDTLRTPIEKLLKRSIEIIIVEPWQ